MGRMALAPRCNVWTAVAATALLVLAVQPHPCAGGITTIGRLGRGNGFDFRTEPSPTADRAPPRVFVDQDGSTDAAATDCAGLIPFLVAHRDGAVDVVGISTHSGDGWQVQGAARFLRLFELVGGAVENIPLHLGAALPVSHSQAEFRAWKEQHVSDLGWMGAFDPKTRPVLTEADIDPAGFKEGMPERLKVSGVLATEALLRAADGRPLTYVALGTLSNLMRAIQVDPTLPQRIERVIWMGGSLSSYDCERYYCESKLRENLEFNLFFDPVPARTIFTSTTYQFGSFEIWTADACGPALLEPWMSAALAASPEPAAVYAELYTPERLLEMPMWDQLVGVRAVALVIGGKDPLNVETSPYTVAVGSTDPGSPLYGTSLFTPRPHGTTPATQQIRLVTGYDVLGFQCEWVRTLTGHLPAECQGSVDPHRWTLGAEA